MADRGNVYYCSWERTDEGEYVGWETKFPRRRAYGDSKSEMQQALGELVAEYHDDQEAALEFDPPLESGGGNADLFADGLVGLSWNAYFQFDDSAGNTFSGGWWRKCGFAVGPRTATPLTVTDIHSGAGGAH